jgi:phage/plasmid-like protein (TIGR03299 family)
MAHEIDQTVNASGAAIYAREAAWHGLGTVLDHAFTSAEALALAGLDFTVEKRPLYTTSGEANDWSLIKLTEFVTTVRTDTNMPLGCVGPEYQVLQNRNAFAAFDDILKDHGAVYETAGSLRGGKRVFIAAKLPESFKVTGAKGDTIEEYLMMFNAHDGTGAIWVIPTSIRPVCANTVGAALGFGFSIAHAKLAQGRALKVKHTTNVDARLKQANNVFEAAHKRTLAAVENAKVLADIPTSERIVKAALDAALAEFGPVNPEMKANQAASGRVVLGAILKAKEKYEEKRDVIGKAILTQIVGEYSLVGKNCWAVYNGVTEYADHGLKYKGERAAENRFQSIISGRVDDFKGELMNAIVYAAGMKAAA